MQSRLMIRNFPPVSWLGVLPEQFKEYQVPGSIVTSAKGSFGDISLQTISASGISLYYVVAELSADLRLQIIGLSSYIVLQIHMNGNYEINAQSLSCNFAGHNHYSLLFLTDSVVNINLFKQADFKMVVLAYPIAFIQSILHFYPLLEDITEKLIAGKTITVLEKSLPVVLSEKIYNLLHTPFAPFAEEYFLRVFREVAQDVLDEYRVVEKPVSSFNMYDISCIHAAKEYIDRHLLEHYTISQLARKSGTNQLKLKKGFKAIYSIGVYGYQRQQRLLIAKTALEKTTKPIHQVAKQAGYRNTANFSAAFKKVNGITPHEYRTTIRKR